MATQQEMEATRLLDGLDGRALQPRGVGDTGWLSRIEAPSYPQGRQGVEEASEEVGEAGRRVGRPWRCTSSTKLPPLSTAPIA
jgi:hypothetical protein